MNINFQELNAQYASNELHQALGILQESLAAISKSITSAMTESFKQITSVVTAPITDMLTKFKENMTLPLIDYRNIDYNYKKIKGLKKLGNKKFTKKSSKM